MAWNLRKLRVEHGLSQDRLALDAGIDRAYLGGLERKTENPTVDILDRLAATLDVPIGAFFIVPDANATEPEPLKGGGRRLR